MHWWQCALWGAFGGLAVEAVQFYGAIRRTGTWPWNVTGEPSWGPLLASVVIRVGLGLGLAIAAGATGQIAGPIAAIAVGVAAPLVVEQMARELELRSGSDAAPPITPGPRPARAPQYAEEPIEAATDVGP